MLVATPAFSIDRTQRAINFRSGILQTAMDKLIHDEISLVVTFDAIAN